MQSSRVSWKRTGYAIFVQHLPPMIQQNGQYNSRGVWRLECQGFYFSIVKLHIPAELLFGRIPLSHLDLLKPDVSLHMKAKQRAQQENHDIHAKERKFEVGESVFVIPENSGYQELSLLRRVHDPTSLLFPKIAGFTATLIT